MSYLGASSPKPTKKNKQRGVTRPKTRNDDALKIKPNVPKKSTGPRLEVKKNGCGGDTFAKHEGDKASSSKKKKMDGDHREPSVAADDVADYESDEAKTDPNYAKYLLLFAGQEELDDSEATPPISADL